jgi:hypothetical protein
VRAVDFASTYHADHWGTADAARPPLRFVHHSNGVAAAPDPK